ncbi:MAG: phosphate uptake regulator PhoU [Candidatus Aenigmarchaeota archaeon]|nr:phosphate uptake regulator PhoU [Candidatus Aenigmarchaeota archaeon]
MDARKIIALGESTFSITLPKRWVVANKLRKGDSVLVRELPLGKLEISPGTREEKPAAKTINIPVDNRPLKEVEREFIAAYIKGYSIINLIGSHEGKIAELRRRLHELIAVEIMEVTKDRITANVFTDISTISLPRILSRIENITMNILQDTAAVVRKKGDRDLMYRELAEKKREVDRQSLFAIRVIVQALTDPVFAGQVQGIQVDPLALSFVWHLIEYMEKTSDYVLNIAFFLTATDSLEKLGPRGREELVPLFAAVGQAYTAALRSYNTKSVPLANEVFELHKKNDRQLYNFLVRYQKHWVPLITGYLRRTSSKARDIAKVTINVNTA